MDVETKPSVPPPPPPPPLPPTVPLLTASHRTPAMSHCSTDGDNGRSRLLADICKGATLKKISITDNNSDKQIIHNISSSHDVSENNLRLDIFLL